MYSVVTRLLTKIGVLSLGKIYGVINAVMGLIIGALITIISLIPGSTMGNIGGALGLNFGVWST